VGKPWGYSMAFWNQGSGQKDQSRRASTAASSGAHTLGVLRKGKAMRVIFFYPGEEGTYVDHAEVTLYENGIVHIASNQEESTTHLQNCEILWNFEIEADERTSSKVRLLKAREVDTTRDLSKQEDSDHPSKPTKPGKGPSKIV
jgi:hypothetical protein